MFSRCVGLPYSRCLWGSRSRKTYSWTVIVGLFLVSYYSSASGDSLTLVNLSLKYSEKNEITTGASEAIACNNCVAYCIANTFHAAFMATDPEMKAWNIQISLNQSISNQQPSLRALSWETWGWKKNRLCWESPKSILWAASMPSSGVWNASKPQSHVDACSYCVLASHWDDTHVQPLLSQNRAGYGQPPRWRTG